MPAAFPTPARSGSTTARDRSSPTRARCSRTPASSSPPSGTALPKYFRAHGAATTYFVLHLPNIVGQPAKPADPASIPAPRTRCLPRPSPRAAVPTPWIALNELFGSGARDPVVADEHAVPRERARADAGPGGARRPPRSSSSAATPTSPATRRRGGSRSPQTGAIVYEAYYDAKRAASLGSLLGSRRMRLGMRSTIALFQGIGITPDRLGHRARLPFRRRAGCRRAQGLQPREAWLRVVKWEALAAKQVAADTRLGSVWSWGWATFGRGERRSRQARRGVRLPLGARPVALRRPCRRRARASTRRWSRGRSSCRRRSSAGSTGDAASPQPTSTRLTALTHDRHAAIDALFARLVLRSTVTVTNAQVLAVENAAIARGLRRQPRRVPEPRWRRPEPRSGMARRTSSATSSAAVRSSRSSPPSGSTEPPLAVAGRPARPRRVNLTICRKDDLPGSGDFPRSDAPRRRRRAAPRPAAVPLRRPARRRRRPATPHADRRARDRLARVDRTGPSRISPATRSSAHPRRAAPTRSSPRRLLDRPAFTDRTAPPGVPVVLRRARRRQLGERERPVARGHGDARLTVPIARR